MISPHSWSGSCVGSESTLHQIGPYIGKMKSTMAKVLIAACSRPGHTILDPFVGSGVVALESLIAGRETISSDINPYAVVLTRAKLFAPSSLSRALTLAEHYLKRARDEYPNVNLDDVPQWVQKFFHPKTLRETIAIAKVLRRCRQHFLMGCLLGILHHQRPGFLSYPASHAIPYLRTKKFPKEKYPGLYQYREVRSRLLKKIQRVYRRFPNIDQSLPRRCFLKDATQLALPDESVDAVVTSPPYMNALDYIRDNRLRLWFLGCTDGTKIGKQNPHNLYEFKKLMYDGLTMIKRVLRSEKTCIIVTGEVNKSGRSVNTAEVVLDAAKKVDGFDCQAMVEDSIPEHRRIRKKGSCTKKEWIVVLRKI